MPIIDKSYFVNDPLSIPNAVEVPDIQPGNPTASDKLIAAIAKYERLLLINALGKIQYDELIADLDATEGKWYDLLNGKNYDGGYWPGLKGNDSLIAYYVYHEYLANDRLQYTTLGLEKSKAENSISINPTEWLTEIWNIFIEMYSGLPLDGRYDWGQYWPYHFDPVNGFYSETGDIDSYVSLRKFISDFPDDYNASFFKEYEVKNRFGL